MKSTIVRAFVLTLVSVGLSAAASAAHSTSTTVKIAPTSVVADSLPLCGPNDPNHCGMD